MPDESVRRPQRNERRKTRFPGVYARESRSRRHAGRPDVCFTIDYRDAGGRRVRKDLGWASEGFSAALASQMRARLIHKAKTKAALGELYTPHPRTLTLGEAFSRYRREWLEARGKRADSDQWMFDAHLAELAPLPLPEITPYLLDSLMTGLTRKGLSPQTVKHMVGLIRRVMRRMAAWGLYAGPMPFAAVKIPRPNNARQRFLTPEEARALLTALKKRSRQTWLMALISLQCGLRFGEIAALRAGDINMAARSICIGESKSGQARHAVMTEDVAHALAELPPRPAEALLFPSRSGGLMRGVSESFNRAVDELGLNAADREAALRNGRTDGRRIEDRRQRVVFHTLRHTYASWLAMSGEGQAMIADLLGHHSLEMSARYTHLMPDARRATARSIERLFSHDGPPEHPE